MGCGSSTETTDSGSAIIGHQQHTNQQNDYTWRTNSLYAQTLHATPVQDVNQQHARAPSNPVLPRMQSNTGVSEHIALVDTAAKFFYTLSEHQRALTIAIAAAHGPTDNDKIHGIISSAFNSVLQICEAIQSIVGRGELVDDPSKAIALFATTTVSLMTVRTIIDLYGLVLFRMEDSLVSLRWPSRTDEQASKTSKLGEAASQSAAPATSQSNQSHVLEICQAIETMDFHIAHIEAVTRKLKDVSWLITQGVSQHDASGGTGGEGLSQSSEIEKILNAALSTRQEITRVKAKIHSRSAT